VTCARGTYGPLDRERHGVLGWGADHTVDYVRDQTIGATLRPLLPVISDAFHAGRGARHWWHASQLMGGRCEAERPAAVVGQELVHTVADRDRAIAHLSMAFRALVCDLAVWQTSHQDYPTASRTAQWIDADVTPTLEEWNRFVAHEKTSWWTKLATSWETFEQWWDRLKQLRSMSRAQGVELQSSEPVALPKTIWQHSEEGKGSEATAILGVLKIGALTTLGIFGAVGLYAAVRNLGTRARSVDDRAFLREIVREELRQRPCARKER